MGYRVSVELLVVDREQQEARSTLLLSSLRVSIFNSVPLLLMKVFKHIFFCAEKINLTLTHSRTF